MKSFVLAVPVVTTRQALRAACVLAAVGCGLAMALALPSPAYAQQGQGSRNQSSQKPPPPSYYQTTRPNPSNPSQPPPPPYYQSSTQQGQGNAGYGSPSAPSGSYSGGSSLLDSHEAARVVIAPPYRNDVLTVMGYGDTRTVNRWMFVYYDPSTPSHGRAVVMTGTRVDRVQPVDSRNQYPRDMAFSPENVVQREPSTILRSAAQIARRKGVYYDNTRLLLRRSTDGDSLIWRVELLQARKTMGYVYVSPRTASVVRYESSDVVSQAKTRQFANEVKETFLNIGGDMEQFFTGKRTVDR
ncbi:hypothetical protein DB346_06910 [Verrucomicrobia bacterium LW23]|nr:hypothetical protein DB346_06910 [Verrucomicrobia bacterium LW23]